MHGSALPRRTTTRAAVLCGTFLASLVTPAVPAAAHQPRGDGETRRLEGEGEAAGPRRPDDGGTPVR